MRVLLVHPSFPPSFWSYEPILRLVGKKALMPPLGLLTVAALLPGDWECRFVDRSVRPMTERDWDFAEMVFVTGMLTQKEDLWRTIAEARRRGKPVVVGGPYATSCPDDARAAGADYLVTDEAELSLPPFLQAVAAGATSGTFTAGGAKPDLTSTPLPRIDLVDLDAYDSMCLQFSRGCPFTCEFCDVIALYGRRPRTKTPAQITAELDQFHECGWRGPVVFVDDNFAGNRNAARAVLREIADWQRLRGFPFHFDTAATIDLAQDPELLDLMVECHFAAVFIGIETPDEASLARIGKHQNLRRPIAEDVDAITRAGIRVMAGFIMGFDGESVGADRRIIEMVERTAVPTACVSLLQALPGTAFWARLEREQRLVPERPVQINQTDLLNFVPTRPLEEIASEFINAFVTLYDPVTYLDRTWRYFLRLGTARPAPAGRHTVPDAVDESWNITWSAVRALLIVVWRQGVVRRSRWAFWHHLASVLRHNPRVWSHYLTVCAHNEHFLLFRVRVRAEIERQVEEARAPKDADQARWPAVGPGRRRVAATSVRARARRGFQRRTAPRR